MITMLGSPRRCCDGITRRETLKAGALTALGGLGLPQLLAAKEAGALGEGKAKNVMMLFLLGGAATQDMVDLKPHGPSETRSIFKPIPTNVPGIDICEHLPRTAQWMHKTAIVRSLNHKAGCHNCLPCYTGDELPRPDQHPRDTDPPSMGSVLAYLNREQPGFPVYHYLPNWLGWGQAFRRAGPYGGFLGKRYDAVTTECSPTMDADAPQPLPGKPNIVRGAPVLPNGVLQDGVTLDRLNSRRSLLSQFEQQLASVNATQIESFSRNQRQAFDILTSSKLRESFDLSEENPKLVERYGKTLFGNSALIGRRLLERGAKFVNVTFDLYWGPVQIDYDAWDTHQKNFDILKENKLPVFDQVYATLLEDLEERGLLDETLILVISEMGRTPRINGNAGRDHWTFCYSCLFAGAGIRGGTIYGASDSQSAYVQDKPVSNSDVVATVYQALGIDPETRVPDHTGRPVSVSQSGEPIWDILA
jgi:hypothetical protein